MNHNIDNKVLRAARILWDYHHLDLGLRPTDFILALGSHDERVAQHAAQLLLKGFAPLLVTSGGFGKVTRNIWEVREGDRFAEIAEQLGVPVSKILIENAGTNTAENLTKTRDLLKRENVIVESGVLVAKPYMRRRAYATAAKQWPEVNWLVSSPPLSFDNYPNEEVSLERMIELMVGDLQRIKVYAERGYQIPQEIPDKVWRSYEELIHSGFKEYVIESEA